MSKAVVTSMWFLYIIQGNIAVFNSVPTLVYIWKYYNTCCKYTKPSIYIRRILIVGSCINAIL